MKPARALTLTLSNELVKLIRLGLVLESGQSSASLFVMHLYGFLNALHTGSGIFSQSDTVLCKLLDSLFSVDSTIGSGL